MGAWGVTVKQSDYGLDLLGTIVNIQLKQVDFTVFNVADILEVVKEDIMEEIRQANRGCSAKQLVHFFGMTFPVRFTQGALLVAECLADYCRTGELVVTEYVGEKCEPVERHIKASLETRSAM